MTKVLSNSELMRRLMKNAMKEANEADLEEPKAKWPKPNDLTPPAAPIVPFNEKKP